MIFVREMGWNPGKLAWLGYGEAGPTGAGTPNKGTFRRLAEPGAVARSGPEAGFDAGTGAGATLLVCTFEGFARPV